MEGCPAAIIPASRLRAKSAASRPALAARKAGRLFEPTSSSPSISHRTFAGGRPERHTASTAARAAQNCPFMSETPRAYRLPPRTTGSNGAECHCSSGPAGCTS